ncbi:MAG: GNAT family N-acetyltransferase [Acidimicrobiales bacterium]
MVRSGGEISDEGGDQRGVAGDASGWTRPMAGAAMSRCTPPALGGAEGTPNLSDGCLDNPVWHALDGPHGPFAQRRALAARYRAAVAPFGALKSGAGVDGWQDASTLDRSGLTVFVAPPSAPPDTWQVVRVIPGIQMVQVDVDACPDARAVELSRADVAEMMDLVVTARPGPFRARAVDLGHYLGFRREGRLVAMAGERMRCPGWTEISAVCTHPSARGEGLATRLVRAMVAHVNGRGDRAFLHVSSGNQDAVALYRRLGFAERAEIRFMFASPPD